MSLIHIHYCKNKKSFESLDPYRTGIVPPAKQPKPLENKESSNKSSTMQHSKLGHHHAKMQGGHSEGRNGAVWQTGTELAHVLKKIQQWIIWWRKGRWNENIYSWVLSPHNCLMGSVSRMRGWGGSWGEPSMELCSHSREQRMCCTICIERLNLLPVGKDLVKEASGSDRGAPHASESDRTTKFRRGQRRPSKGNTTKTFKGL